MTAEQEIDMGARQLNFHETERDLKWQNYLQHKQQLIESATQARDKGISYREIKFQVGCSILGNRAGEDGGLIVNGFNYTPTKKPHANAEKRCAERNAVQRGLEKGITKIDALVTVSCESSTNNNPDEKMALHPCRDCRDLLRQLKDDGVMTDDTIICSINDKHEIIEERTLSQLLELYDNDETNTVLIETPDRNYIN